MQLEYKLDEKDLVRLARYQMESSPRYVRRYRIQRWGLLGLFLVLAAVAQFALNKPAVALYALVLGLFTFSLYPLYYRWVVGRTLRQIAGARLNPTIFGLRKLRLTAEGLEQLAAGKRTVVPWSQLGVVSVTPEHAFISVDGVYAHVIPRARVDEERFMGFVQALRAGQPGERADGS